jgi:hypothetical protein
MTLSVPPDTVYQQQRSLSFELGQRMVSEPRDTYVLYTMIVMGGGGGGPVG